MTLDLRERLARRYDRVRARTVALARPLADDDQLAQAFPDASPTKWHLGHTTWFFDRFVLAAHDPGHPRIDPGIEYVFNSYYEAIGARQPRAERSLATRPTLAEVRAYRARVDEAMRRFVETADDATFHGAARALELGTHHEEQHQELILTDVKALFATSPMHPAYVERPTSVERAAPTERPPHEAEPPTEAGWVAHPGGLVEIGAARLAIDGFAFDNEGPRHRVWLEPFELASRCVTAREYLAFVEDGGYARPLLWLSDGWAVVREQGWSAPAYWKKTDDGWREHTLYGLVSLDLDAPVAHVSAYEADAFARWAGARLPSEAEWETIAAPRSIDGNLAENIEDNLEGNGALHPRPARGASPAQLFGDVWEWTSSAYAPYPRFLPFEGSFAEYNGKFMVNQLVLRGGSCFTPREHLRATYRNFFPASARWQMTGVRLARWR